MMRAIYFVRVLLISPEALLIGVGALAWYHFSSSLSYLATTISLNEELLKYLMVVPVGLAVWIANELRQLLQEDKDTTRFLVGWPDYWKLKLHLWVSLIYAAVFACLSLAPWVVRAGISTGAGILLFLISIVGQLVLSTSVYAARLRVKELLANAPEE
jgi:hypothetical protein